jgi:hypothetical protein
MAPDQTYLTYAKAVTSGPYDEQPTLPDSLDLQLTLSKNTRPQPFYLICEFDTILVAMSGRGRVLFKSSSVLQHDYGVGDLIYVPAGTPHRIMPSEESIHQRFKLPESELEGVAWFCENCGGELHRAVWQLADELPQEAYLRTCKAFSADAALRGCSTCDTTHPVVDLAEYRWQSIAEELRASSKDS